MGEAQRFVAELPAGVEHGTLTAYTKYDCRCDACREFWNAYMVWWRAERRGRLHGACPTCTCPMPEKPISATPPGVGDADV